MALRLMEKIHLDNPNCSPQELQQIIRSNLKNPLEIHHFNHKNHSLVKVNLFVQDNGFQPQMSPFMHPIYNKNEQSTMHFLTRDFPDPDWELANDPVSRYIEKQPHMCILSTFEPDTLGLEKMMIKDSVVKQKLPGFDPNGVCVVKTIGPMLPLNQMVQVLGYLEHPLEDMEDLLFVLPTIHCVSFSILTLQDLIPKSMPILDIKYLRMNLIKSLKNELLGDVLAAEYVAAHLFYRMYFGLISSKRIGGVPTSNFSLNIYHPLFKSSGVDFLLREAWPMTKRLAISIDTLQNSFMQPEQDRFEELGLCFGELQQPDHTLFLLDESKMDTGKLQDRGVKNVKALQNCIDFGLVDYEVPFGTFDKESNFSFLSVGKNPSLLNMTCKLPLLPAVDCQPEPVSLDANVKYFIASMKEKPFVISDEMENVIQEDFTADQALARQNGLPTDDGTLLMQRLVLSECIAKSYGYDTLTKDSWEKAGKMEKDRLRRLLK
jgi:hypothetical protein